MACVFFIGDPKKETECRRCTDIWLAHFEATATEQSETQPRKQSQQRDLRLAPK
jgi:hypothetical protein